MIIDLTIADPDYTEQEVEMRWNEEGIDRKSELQMLHKSGLFAYRLVNEDHVDVTHVPSGRSMSTITRTFADVRQAREFIEAAIPLWDWNFAEPGKLPKYRQKQLAKIMQPLYNKLQLVEWMD